MSALFGPVIQQGCVVANSNQARHHWIARGIGPFFIEAHIRPKGRYDNQPIQPELSATFAYSGDQQIEVMDQLMARSEHPVALMETVRDASTGGPTSSFPRATHTPNKQLPMPPLWHRGAQQRETQSVLSERAL
jgi:hypothetical protein